MMVSNDVRKGISQSRFNEEQSNVVYAEILLIAIGAGFYYKNWFVFGFTLIGLIVTLLIPYLNIILALVLSILWGFIGYAIGMPFSSQASYVVGALSFISGLGIHLSAIEWSKDIANIKQ